MRSARHHLARLAIVPMLALGLVACGEGQDPGPDPTESATTEASPTPTTEASPTETTETSPTEETSATTTTTQRTSEDAIDESVEEVAEEFASLAPASLFAQFESCDPSGLEDSWQCSGAAVGQFQFFSGSAKAASTTQLLTELRSSRVVEDTGDRVVGWSTLGTTAVITVVDNERGQVLQQMISSDREDPEEIIYDLGLAEEPAEETTTAESDNEDA